MDFSVKSEHLHSASARIGVMAQEVAKLEGDFRALSADLAAAWTGPAATQFIQVDVPMFEKGMRDITTALEDIARRLGTSGSVYEQAEAQIKANLAAGY